MDSNSLSFEVRGIAGVLSSNNLSVPIYQRSYAWDIEQVTEYWEDIITTFSARESEYFLGTIVLAIDGESGRKHIIDGQQRLATTSIILASIRNIFESKDDSDRANYIQTEFLAKKDLKTASILSKLYLSSDDRFYFQKRVIENRECNKKKKSHDHIERALEKFTTELEQRVSEEGNRWAEFLSDLVLFLEEQIKTVVLEVSNDADAYVIFETLNDRGADLTIADLLKNYLFGKAGDTHLDFVRDGWISALASLEVSSENSIYIKFLRQYWSSRVGLVRERDLYKSIKKDVDTADAALEFISNLQSSSDIYAALLNDTHPYWDELGYDARVSIEVLLRLGIDQNRPLLLAALEVFAKEEKIKLLKSLVSWSVRSLIVGGLGGGAFEGAYCRAAVKVRTQEIKTTSEVLAELSSIVPSDAVFRSEFSSALVQKSSHARYYLIALENKHQNKSEPEFVPNKNAEEVNLEHVLPKKAKLEDWPIFTQDEANEYVYRIGNLALLKKSKNSLIGNRPFSVKKPVLELSEFALTNEIGAKDDWTTLEIEARQQRLADLAVQIWKR